MTGIYQDYKGNNYKVAIYSGKNNIMTVTRNNVTKTVKIKPEEYDLYGNIYKLQKTQIRAINGAAGLFKFIDEAISGKFMESLAYKVLDHVIDTMKEAPAGI